MQGIFLRFCSLFCALAITATGVPAAGAAASPPGAEPAPLTSDGGAAEAGGTFAPGPQAVFLRDVWADDKPWGGETQAAEAPLPPATGATGTDLSGEVSADATGTDLPGEVSTAADATLISNGATFKAFLEGLAANGSYTVRLGASFTATFTTGYVQPEGSTLNVETNGHTADIRFSGGGADGPYLYTVPAGASLLLDDSSGGGLNLTANVAPGGTNWSDAASGAILYAWGGASVQVSTLTDLAGLPHLYVTGSKEALTRVHIRGGIVSGGTVPLDRVITGNNTRVWIDGQLPDLDGKNFVSFWGYASGNPPIPYCSNKARDEYSLFASYDGYLEYATPANNAYVWLSEAANLEAGAKPLLVRAGVGGKLVGADPSGSYAAGARVPVSAAADSGYVFAGWLAMPGGNFADATALSTTFEATGRRAEVVAQFLPVLKDEEWKGVAAANAERFKANSSALPLATARQFTLAVRKRSDEIVKKFSHDRPNGSKCTTVLDEYNVARLFAGENIAAGNSTVPATIKQWMNSEGHKRNMLDNRWDQMAMTHSYSADSTYGHYWTQMFLASPTLPYYINLPAIQQQGVYAKTGTSLNNLDLRLILTYEDGFTATIPVISQMCTGYNASAEGRQTITIRYGNATVTQSVTLTADGNPSRDEIPDTLVLEHNGGPSGPALGDTLSVKPWDADAAGNTITVRYTWLRNGAVIPGPAGPSRTVTRDDLGCEISVMATGYGSYAGQTTSNAVAVPATAPHAPSLTVTLRPNGYFLQWNAPFNGGSAITGHNVYLAGKATPLAGSPFTGRSCLVDYGTLPSPLPTSIAFEVAAINRAGEGARGAASHTLAPADSTGALVLEGDHFTLPQGGSHTVKLDFTPDNPHLPATLEADATSRPTGASATDIAVTVSTADGGTLKLDVAAGCAPGAYTVTVRLAQNPALCAALRLDVTGAARQPGPQEAYETRAVESTKVTLYTLKEVPAEITLQPPAFAPKDVPWPLHDATRFTLSFADPDLAAALSLEAVDARTLRATPKGNLNTLLPKSSYTSALVATPLDGSATPEITGAITFKINRKPPALKAAALKINSFYDDVSAAVAVSGGEVLALAPAAPLPTWLELDGTALRLKPQADGSYKKASATVKLAATLKGWGAAAVPVSVKVSAASTAPGLKFTPATVKLFADLSRGGSTQGTLAAKKGGVSPASLGVLDLKLADTEAEAYAQTKNYHLSGFDAATGAFTLTARANKAGELKSGKVLLAVTLAGRTAPYTMPLSVNAVKAGTKISFKAGSTSLKLNPAAGDSTVVKLTPSVPGLWIPAADLHTEVQGPDGGTIAEALAPVAADTTTLNAGFITISTTAHARPGTTYKLRLTIDNLGEDSQRRPTGQTLTFKVTTPKTGGVAASLTAKGAANLTTGTPAAITLKFTGFAGGLTEKYAADKGINPATLFHISRVEKGVPKGGGADVSTDFTVAQTGTNTFSVTPNPGAARLAAGSYHIQLSTAGKAALQAAMPGVQLTARGTTLKVKATAPGITQSAKAGGLYRSDPLTTARTVLTLPAGARAIRDVQIKAGKNSEYFEADYKNGVCSISFKSGSGYEEGLTAKRVTLKLEVMLEGNQKAAKTISYTVTVY